MVCCGGVIQRSGMPSDLDEPLSPMRQHLRPLLLVLGIWPATAMTQQPLWEAGLGIGGLYYPHYRGSASSETLVFPIPYLVYRGDLLRFDRDGLRGLLFTSERVELDLSLDGVFPVNDDGNAREGMDRLSPILEAGPSINITLWEQGERLRYLMLRLPLRAAISVDAGPRVGHEGWAFAPNLYWVDNAAGISGQWRRTLSLGPVFADSRYHDYFYTVRARDEIPGSRPRFRADGGYSGLRLSFASSRRVGPVWLGLFARYERLDGAAFERSPLVERRYALLVGAGLSWVFAESDRTVPRRD